MNQSVVVVGLGQLGSLFAQGFLRAGYGVVPVRRGDTLEPHVSADTQLVLVAAGEDDVKAVLAQVPQAQLHKVVLLQNELRPATWSQFYPAEHNRDLGEQRGPTACIVWFEKKAERPAQVVLPSVLFGPKSDEMVLALEQLRLPSRRVSHVSQLHHELCLKNLYILGLNFCGLVGVQTAGELQDHRALFEPVVDELITLEQEGLKRAGETTQLDPKRLKVDLYAAIEADKTHGCAGRSAPIRLARTLALGLEWHVDLPHCKKLADGAPV